MQTTQTVVEISGILGGPIWEPGFVCAKHFNVSATRHPSGMVKPVRNRPTMRELIDSAVSGHGDFQDVQIADATVTITRTRRIAKGTTVRQVRQFDIRMFESVSAYLVEDESERYYEIMDAMEIDQ